MFESLVDDVLRIARMLLPLLFCCEPHDRSYGATQGNDIFRFPKHRVFKFVSISGGSCNRCLKALSVGAETEPQNQAWMEGTRVGRGMV